MLAILCALPKLKQVMLIGDPYQLPPYCPFTERSDVVQFSNQSCLERLAGINPDTAVLSRIYRCHRLLTENIINRMYPKDVQSAVPIVERNGANEMKLPRADDGTPFIFYHVEGRYSEGANENEAYSIKKFIDNIIKENGTVNHQDIVVLTYHRKQRTLLTELLPDKITVKTIDGFQGQQAKIVIVATTKTTSATNGEEKKKDVLRGKRKERTGRHLQSN